MDDDLNVIRKDDWFNLFTKMCEALIKLDQAGEGARFALRAIRTNVRYHDRQPLTSDPVKKEVIMILFRRTPRITLSC